MFEDSHTTVRGTSVAVVKVVAREDGRTAVGICTVREHDKHAALSLQQWTYSMKTWARV
jgi:hypothetical protein